MNRSTGALGALVLCLLVLGCDVGATQPMAVPSAPAVASSMPSRSPAPTATAPTGTIADIAALRERVAVDPDDAEALRDLGLALLQRVRETADPSLYRQAEEALLRAKERAPDDALALVGLGALELGRHQFAAAFETARSAIKLAPALVSAKAVEVDALVELGRYEEAVSAAQELAGLGIDITSLARLSYLRELHGNIKGAIAAMQQAAEAPALAPENTAYVTTILGNLLVYAGEPAEAKAAYESALTSVPDHAAAIAGLGRLAVGRGDLTEAVRRFEKAAAILPLPEYVIALGETREAAGDTEGRSRVMTSLGPRRRCSRRPGSTSIWSWPCLKPTTATRRSRSDSRNSLTKRVRPSARPTPWPGHPTGRAETATPSAYLRRHSDSGVATRSSSTTPG